MSITTATELKTALANWLHTDDHTDRLDDYIALAEAGFNRDLRVSAMEDTLASTALVSGAASLPANFLAFKELRYDGSPVHTLEPRPIEWIRNKPDLADRPSYFAVTGTQVVCWPQTGSIKGTFYRSIPSLTSNATNWLLTAHPDLYLFACLTEAAIYEQDDARASMWRQRAVATLEQVRSADAGNLLNGGPLRMRPR